MKTLSILLLAGVCEACTLAPGEVLEPPGSMDAANAREATPSSSLEAPSVALAADYRSWPLILNDVQRADSGQVRDIYINPVGAGTRMGQPFPNGTVMVMDLFAAQKDAAGNTVLGSDGTLLKGALLKTFVMGKDAGWGGKVEPALQNGDWLYAVYAADLTPLSDSTTSCFACHLPLGASKDWVHRYDELVGRLHTAPTSG